ncbi:MAG: hypothetical protein LBP78_02060, partial [Acidaminococcales bacterium]|nr:hypothetical protein [Acidaminococcales bacterium]
YVKKLTQTAKQEKPVPSADIHVEELEDRLALALGTQVRIKRQGGKGKIFIDFYSDQDLERLLEIFSRPRPPSAAGKGGFAV